MQVIPSPSPAVDHFATVYEMPSLNHFSSSGRDSSDQDIHATKDQSLEEKSERPRALVVDDAPDVTEMIAMFLEHAGYATVMAFSAPEALEAVRQQRHFDVIVSDIGMPGMNGYDLAIALRAMPEYTNVPMVAVTGFSMYDDRGRALESGFNAHMTKPINPMRLLDLIKSLMEG
jgi:CheY-like chemotaxis protein